jgi:hypothetical protein
LLASRTRGSPARKEFAPYAYSASILDGAVGGDKIAHGRVTNRDLPFRLSRCGLLILHMCMLPSAAANRVAC